MYDFPGKESEIYNSLSSGWKQVESFWFPLEYQYTRKLVKTLIVKLDDTWWYTWSYCGSSWSLISLYGLQSDSLCITKAKARTSCSFLFEPFRAVILDRLLKFLKENNPFYRNLVVKAENVLPHVSSSNDFDGSCQPKKRMVLPLVI